MQWHSTFCMSFAFRDEVADEVVLCVSGCGASGAASLSKRFSGGDVLRRQRGDLPLNLRGFRWQRRFPSVVIDLRFPCARYNERFSLGRYRLSGCCACVFLSLTRSGPRSGLNTSNDEGQICFWDNFSRLHSSCD